MNEKEKELRKIKNIALQTWGLIAQFYDAGISPSMKEDGTPVTEADKLANKFILENLKKTFPDYNIVSEEDKNINLNGNRTFYVDPIDGTKGFFKRNGQFATHIGLCEGESPIMGVVYWPVTGDMYSGINGIGAWRENQRGILELKVKCSERKWLIASANGDYPVRELAPIFEKIGVDTYHNSGSEGLRLMKIAENSADVRINESKDGTNTWDLCAPQAVLEAAGGIVKYMDGKPILYQLQGRFGKRYFATNTDELADKIIKVYNKATYQEDGAGQSDD